METTQDMDTEWGLFIANPLGIPLILRKIFQHFSTTKLIGLSLVNKQWNYEARSLMKIRGNLSARLDERQACQDLRMFAADLQRMKETKKIDPFSGMSISLGGLDSDCEDLCHQSANKEMKPFYESILNGLKWKYLSIRILAGWEEHKSCPGFVLLKKIVENFASVLEELSVELERNAARNFTQEFLQGCNFSSLKTFNLTSEEETEGSVPEYTGLIKTVVSHAPNLQVFYSTVELDLHANLLEGSSAVHMARCPYPLDSIPTSVPSDLRLYDLLLQYFHPDLSLEDFNRMTSTVLQSSRTIMDAISVDVVLLVPLMVYGICLENVDMFHMSVDLLNLDKQQPDIWRPVKSFNFTRLFPNLDTVSIQHSSYLPRDEIPEGFNEMIEKANVISKTPAPDRAANIKHLELQYVPAAVLCQRSSFCLLAEMFPSVQKLSIGGGEAPFVDIRDIWPDLKEVNVTLHCSGRWPINLDSIFCGIFPQEVAQLNQEDEEYLQKVHIVPVIPPISYLKDLRTFRVYYDEDDTNPNLRTTDQPTSAISKVSGLIGFQRCPNLTATLTTGDEKIARALSHLKPYASVVLI